MDHPEVRVLLQSSQIATAELCSSHMRALGLTRAEVTFYEPRMVDGLYEEVRIFSWRLVSRNPNAIRRVLRSWYVERRIRYPNAQIRRVLECRSGVSTQLGNAL